MCPLSLGMFYHFFSVQLQNHCPDCETRRLRLQRQNRLELEKDAFFAHLAELHCKTRRLRLQRQNQLQHPTATPNLLYFVGGLANRQTTLQSALQCLLSYAESESTNGFFATYYKHITALLSMCHA